jgi:hypothetical protein
MIFEKHQDDFLTQYLSPLYIRTIFSFHWDEKNTPSLSVAEAG